MDGFSTFNKTRKCLLWYAPALVVNESMSAWVPKSTARGGLPNITYVSRKPKPLGTKVKVIAEAMTGCFISIEIQHGKKDTAKAKYVKEVIKKNSVYSLFGGKTFNFDLSVRPIFYVKFGSKVETYEDNDLENFMLSNPDYYRVPRKQISSSSW